LKTNAKKKKKKKKPQMSTQEFEVTFVTGNAGKLRETKAIVGDAVALKSQAIDRTCRVVVGSWFLKPCISIFFFV
jgi:hypothetical protein